jgi:hypothetical protein
MRLILGEEEAILISLFCPGIEIPGNIGSPRWGLYMARENLTFDLSSVRGLKSPATYDRPD